MKKIKSALISVFDKDNLEPIVRLLAENNVVIYSTGGTQSFIEDLGIKVVSVESATTYPSILGGRVKTLHPKIFGGILHRRDHETDLHQIREFDIPPIDLVIVDLYPFEKTVASKASHEDIIEKIDIGGISLIRAAAKNYNDVVIVPSKEEYTPLLKVLSDKNCSTELGDRMWFAAKAFAVSSHYDSAIFNYFSTQTEVKALRQSVNEAKVLRYGENPHQQGEFYGDLDQLFDQIHGKELSYNNLIDVDAAIGLIDEFQGETAVAILKHNNACGCAVASTTKEAYLKALQADPVSAFGGVIISTTAIDKETAEELDKLFFEILIAPSFSEEALQILKSKKNRILLIRKDADLPAKLSRTLLNGVIQQDKDAKSETLEDLKIVTKIAPSEEEKKALLFANKICKHTKSNAIVFSNSHQLFASGVGQTSRVDALRQAIEKANSFGFDLKGAVMASDAFFPFPDCVEIAHKAGIVSVIHPGGSIRDQESIDFCDNNNMSMAITGFRHFKH